MAEGNLYTSADGILETHVTWNDIEEEMQKAFNSSATFGPEKSVRNIGEGNGFMSRMCLITADWQNKDNAEMPDAFVVKICSQLTMIQFSEKLPEDHGMRKLFSQPDLFGPMEYMVKMAHDTEVNTYRLILKYLEPGKIPSVKIHALKKFSEGCPLKGYIIMDLVDNVQPFHIWKNMEPEILKEAVQTLAIIHSISLKMTEEEKASFNYNMLSEMMAKFFNDEQVENCNKMLREFHNGAMEERVDKMAKLSSEILNYKRGDRTSAIAGIKPVLCHGDLWSMNLLWSKTDEGIKLASIIDFQTANFGNPMSDLVRLFNAALSAKDRREHWQELVQLYYETFEQEAHGHEMPFTLEQLIVAYNVFYPLGSYMIIFGIAPMFDILSGDMDEETKAKTIENVLEKSEGMIDDLLEYHEKFGDVDVAVEKCFDVTPKEVDVAAAGGEFTLTASNSSGRAVVFKMKASNNRDYRVKPVYGIVPTNSSTTITVVRKTHEPSKDRFVVEFCYAPSNLDDLSATFTNFKNEIQHVTVHINAQ